MSGIRYDPQWIDVRGYAGIKDRCDLANGECTQKPKASKTKKHWNNFEKYFTLKEGDEPAKDVAEDEISEQLTDESERHAENAQQEIGNGQIEQKHVGDGPHPAVLQDSQDHQDVARVAQQENDAARRKKDKKKNVDMNKTRKQMSRLKESTLIKKKLNTHNEHGDDMWPWV